MSRLTGRSGGKEKVMSASSTWPAQESILIVDDTLANLSVLALLLKKDGLKVRPVPSGALALRAAAADPPDLILLDINMPEMDGYEVCRRLKEDAVLAQVPVIFLSALTDTQDKITAFTSGGVDYVTKPFQVEELQARVETHLKLRRLQRQIEAHNHRLQELVDEQVKEISDSQIATIMALSNLAESRDDDTGAHIKRVQAYCRLLAMRLSDQRDLATVIDPQFIANLTHASPMHDIGKVAIPDRVLLKPGPLDVDELAIMRSHTVIGAKTLETVRAMYPHNTFVNMGAQIARSHHERWDGGGYPDGLHGEAIPLPARILAAADQYDALRSVRPYKEAYSHRVACSIITAGDGRTMPAHFDPRVLQAFKDCASELEEIHDALQA
jgi:putative two-component system response regulator